jgi:hypothetical protein
MIDLKKVSSLRQGSDQRIIVLKMEGVEYDLRADNSIDAGSWLRSMEEALGFTKQPPQSDSSVRPIEGNTPCHKICETASTAQSKICAPSASTTSSTTATATTTSSTAAIDATTTRSSGGSSGSSSSSSSSQSVQKLAAVLILTAVFLVSAYLKATEDEGQAQNYANVVSALSAPRLITILLCSAVVCVAWLLRPRSGSNDASDISKENHMADGEQGGECSTMDAPLSKPSPSTEHTRKVPPSHKTFKVPVSQFYVQHELADLKTRYKEELATLRAMLGGELPASNGLEGEDEFLYDDVFLVRYILSYERKGKLPKAAHAIRETLAHRQKHANSLAQAAKGIYPKPEVHAAWNENMPQGTVPGQSPTGDLILIVRDGVANKAGFITAAGEEGGYEYLLLKREALYRQIDRRSRAEGRLLKVVIVCDCAGGGLAGLNRQYMRVDGKCSKLCEMYYPQLMGKIVLVNPPSILPVLMRICKHFISASTLEKIVCCEAKPSKRHHCKCARCFLLSQQPSEVPSFLGGSAPDALISVN